MQDRYAVPLGVYINADSPIHRLGAGIKSLGLIAIIGLSLSLVHTWKAALAFAVVCTAGYAIARIPPRVAWRQVWPLLPILVMFAALLWWQDGAAFAATRILVLLGNIILATLMTLTTRVSEMMDALERGLHPLERFGVPTRAISLGMSLTIRLIPLQLATVAEVLDARKARGLGSSPTAFGAPVVIRSVTRAEKIADALIARGAMDERHTPPTGDSAF